MRTSPASDIALLDCEDVGKAPGVADLAWLLVSSAEPARWDEVIAAYGDARYLAEALPSIAVQGFLSMSDAAAGSAASQCVGHPAALGPRPDQLSPLSQVGGVDDCLGAIRGDGMFVDFRWSPAWPGLVLLAGRGEVRERR